MGFTRRLATGAGALAAKPAFFLRRTYRQVDRHSMAGAIYYCVVRCKLVTCNAFVPSEYHCGGFHMFEVLTGYMHKYLLARVLASY